MPATPTSYTRETRFPIAVAVTAASSATGMSEVPAEMIAIGPSPSSVLSRNTEIIRASR